MVDMSKRAQCLAKKRKKTGDIKKTNALAGQKYERKKNKAIRTPTMFVQAEGNGALGKCAAKQCTDNGGPEIAKETVEAD